MLVAETERLKFLVAFRPGVLSPTLAAQMAATFQRHSEAGCCSTSSPAASPPSSGPTATTSDKDARYRRTGEFLDVVRGAVAGRDGRRCTASTSTSRGARSTRVPDPVPPVYFGGSSPEAGEVAAQHVDVYLTWGEPPAQVAREGRLDPPAGRRAGRDVRFGIRLHVITRDTSDAAWAHAEQYLAASPDR